MQDAAKPAGESKPSLPLGFPELLLKRTRSLPTINGTKRSKYTQQSRFKVVSGVQVDRLFPGVRGIDNSNIKIYKDTRSLLRMAEGRTLSRRKLRIESRKKGTRKKGRKRKDREPAEATGSAWSGKRNGRKRTRGWEPVPGD